MSISDKPNDIRPAAKQSLPTTTPALRRGANKRATRRIGAAHHPVSEQAGVVPAGQVIKLSWADTFGRPARISDRRSAPISAQVLSFRDRAGR